MVGMLVRDACSFFERAGGSGRGTLPTSEVTSVLRVLFASLLVRVLALLLGWYR